MLRSVAAGLVIILPCQVAWAAAKPVDGTVFAFGPRVTKKIALTFDACSTRQQNDFDGRIPKILVSTHTPATFFVSGSWAKAEPRHLQELADEPLFEIANHSYSHPHLTRASDERVRLELSRTQEQILAVTGQVPTLFRPPFGEYDARVARIAEQVGLTTIEYDLPSGDPDARASRAKLVEWVLRRAKPGSIIVMHVNHPRFHTAEALPGIIEALRSRGYELVTVSELLATSNARAYAANEARLLRLSPASAACQGSCASPPAPGVAPSERELALLDDVPEVTESGLQDLSLPASGAGGPQVILSVRPRLEARGRRVTLVHPTHRAERVRARLLPCFRRARLACGRAAQAKPARSRNRSRRAG